MSRPHGGKRGGTFIFPLFVLPTCALAHHLSQRIDNGIELLGLRGKLLSCRGSFFGIGGGDLSELLDVSHGRIELIDSLCLFFAGGGDFTNKVSYLLYGFSDLPQGLADFLCRLNALVGYFL